MSKKENLKPVSFNKVNIYGRFWLDLKKLNKNKILPAIYKVYEKTGRIASFKHDWNEESWYKPHVFWDSDVAKWMETAAYIIGTNKDKVKDTEQNLEDIIDLIEENQDENGYFNTYFQTVEPDQKWKRFNDHELYCIGHLIEAAVAYKNATGKDRFIKIMEKAVEHIYDVFVVKQTAEFKYPGHEEIELALIRLYSVTKNKKHLKLAQHFLYERGRKYESCKSKKYKDTVFQQHLPVEKQYYAIGHAVRAAYLYSAMADVAAIENDNTLWNTVKKLWDDITLKKMYVTGGVGTSFSGEAYTYPYDLPNEYGYTETCASIGLIFLAAKMMQYDLDSKYADILERALYNTVIGGVSLDGTKFFYSNPIETDPKLNSYLKVLKENNIQNKERVIPKVKRSKDLGCMCCPANITRLIASINKYISSVSDDKIAIHLPVQSEIQVDEGYISLSSEYPVGSNFKLEFNLNEKINKKLCFRVPKWCNIDYVSYNGGKYDFSKKYKNGYLIFDKPINDGTKIIINTGMDVILNRANPAVKDASGKVAVQKGPVVYCLEEEDNGQLLKNAYISGKTEFKFEIDEDISNIVPVLTCTGKKIMHPENDIYYTENYSYTDRKLKFIPFYARLNRKLGEMIVWINEYNE